MFLYYYIQPIDGDTNVIIEQIHSYQIYRIVRKAIYIFVTDTSKKPGNYVLKNKRMGHPNKLCVHTGCMFLKTKLFYTKNVKITKAFVENHVTISLLISN